MSRQQFDPYRPSNGTEGMYFMAEFCERCANDVNEDCPIIPAAMAFDKDEPGYPRDTWVYFNGKPTCLAFRELGGDDDPTASPRPVDPAQVDLFADAPIPDGFLLPVLS